MIKISITGNAQQQEVAAYEKTTDQKAGNDHDHCISD